jgi:predicted Zn-dependent protease
LALDPHPEGALYPLYQIRKESEDVAGARAALSEYRKRLTQGDAFFPVVEALLAELDGDCARALELLEPLETLPAQQRLDLRLPLVVGRNRLILGDLDGAEASLLEQVRGAPQNGAAWEYLAQIHLLRHDAARPPASLAHLDAAEQAAARANDWDPHRARPFHLRVEIALRRLRARSDRYSPMPAELLANAERRLDELRRLDAHDPLLAPYTSDLLFERALEALGRGDRAGARASFEQCLATYPDSLVAAVLLAQELWLAGEFAASLARLEHALSIWDARRWECHWLFTAQVWALGAADRLGDAERALRAHDAAEEWLAAGACAPDPAAVLTLAEFLAQSADEGVRDCARALELIGEHDLERVFAERDDALTALREIRRACP